MASGKAKVAKEELAVAPEDRPEMVTPLQRKSLEKEGYDIIGTHSAVKLCRWTKHQLRGRGGCYKHTCYGIVSYQCMEATPSLACANKYVLLFAAAAVAALLVFFSSFRLGIFYIFFCTFFFFFLPDIFFFCSFFFSLFPRCVFCWRHHKNPVGTKWRWKQDPPQEIVSEAIARHRKMIHSAKGVPGVKMDRWTAAVRGPKHCALSLVGEPIM